MTIETDRPTKIYETPEETKARLGRRIIRLTDLRIDLTRISRGVAPSWHTLAMHYPGPLKEAVNITNHELFNTWSQIQDTGDELLTALVAHERGRLRAFFETPLDDR